MKLLSSTFSLPNGSYLKNRIAKSAMSENMGTLKNAPTKNLINAYRVWSNGDSGLLITGNIMIDSMAIGEPRNVVVEDYSNFELLKEWAKSVKGTGTHIWSQVYFAGLLVFVDIINILVGQSAVGM